MTIMPCTDIPAASRTKRAAFYHPNNQSNHIPRLLPGERLSFDSDTWSQLRVVLADSMLLEVRKVLGVLRRAIDEGRPIRRTPRSIFFETVCWIYSIALGRVSRAGDRRYCWAGAFRALRGKHFSHQQISSLDRHLDKQIGFLTTEMNRLIPSLEWDHTKICNHTTRSRKKLADRRGYALSYRAFFEDD